MRGDFDEDEDPDFEPDSGGCNTCMGAATVIESQAGLRPVKITTTELRTRMDAQLQAWGADSQYGEIASAVLGLLDEQARLRELVNQQAEDTGLWFVAARAPEAYLQHELRRLHMAIETGVTALTGATED